MGRGEVGAAQGSLIGKLPRTSGITSGILWDSSGIWTGIIL
jgi:hypothetical protein